MTKEKWTDAQWRAFLAEASGIPNWPEYLHFLEPDGTITSKRLLDCTREDWQRNMDQLPTAAIKNALGELSDADFEMLLEHRPEGHA